MVSLKIELGKKNITWMVLLAIVLVVGVVYAYAPWDNTKSMFHSGDDIKIIVNGEATSLQDAINEGNIGEADDQTLSVSGQTLSISSGNSVSLPSGSKVYTTFD